MRYAGQGHNVSVSLPWRKITHAMEKSLLREFEKRYRQLYGHLVPNAAPQVITWRLTGRSVVKSYRFSWGDSRVSGKPPARSKRDIWLPLKRRSPFTIAIRSSPVRTSPVRSCSRNANRLSSFRFQPR
jgi:N-methylhydantoinase A